MASDVQSILVGETWRRSGMVAKASGSAIVSGAVSYYLKCLSGAHAGRWWKDSDQTWAATETANAMTHQADGNWTIELTESPFEADVIYLEYAKALGDTHVAGEGRLLRGEGPDSVLASILAQVAFLQSGLPYNVVSPVQRTGTLDIVAGADYPADDGKALQIPCSEPTDPTSVASLGIKDDQTGEALLTADGTFEQIGSNWYAVFDLTEAETILLIGHYTSSRRKWDLLEIPADGHYLPMYAGAPCNVTKLTPR
jgi:hypothetical protein